MILKSGTKVSLSLVVISSRSGMKLSLAVSLNIGVEATERTGLGLGLIIVGDIESFRHLLARSPRGVNIFLGEWNFFPRLSNDGLLVSPCPK